MAKNKVELRPAYEWTCDECGRGCFVGGVIVEVDEAMKADLRKSNLDKPPMLETGYWQTEPTEVACSHCGAEFEVESPFEADDDQPDI